MIHVLSTTRIRNYIKMLSVLFLLLLILFFIKDYKIQQPLPFKEQNLTQYVNPFIGTTSGGNTFPGADYPFGMVAWSPDTDSKPYSGGYEYKDPQITGFSLTHLSGSGLVTGQQIPILPYVGKITKSPAENPAQYYSSFSHDKEEAHPGYYRVVLNEQDIKIELTATARTGFGRFIFPSSEESTLLVNRGGVSRKRFEEVKSEVNIINNKEITGFSEDNPGHPIYFYAIFDKPFIGYGTWNGPAVSINSNSAIGTESGAFVSFDTTKDNIVNMKIGISYVSVSSAKGNLQAENPNWDFLSIKQKANIAWNKMLNKIQVQGNNNDKTIFYTALYHAFLHPNIFSDANGEYIGFDNKIYSIPKGHNQYQYFSNWDIYRNQIQLLAILDPNRTSDMMQSLVNDAQQGNGTIPIWEGNNMDYGIMSGDSGIPVVASAYAFGATNFDLKVAISAMLNPNSRINNKILKEQGYISNEDTGISASETLEYATDNFSIASLMSLTGNKNLCLKYLEKSQNWQNLFNVKTGYIQPKNKKGEWNQKISSLAPTGFGSGFQEGYLTNYTWMVPHDLPKLISLMSGKTNAISKLDESFLNDKIILNNQPTFLSPWVYTFAGLPSRTQKIVRNSLTTNFTNSPGGLPGNDDAGSTSSWYIFSAVGIYPAVPGIGGFIIGAPFLKSTSIILPNGNYIEIDAQKESNNSLYIKSLKISGVTYSNTWLSWDKVKNGAKIEYALSDLPSDWGTKKENLPPVFTSPAMCDNSMFSVFSSFLESVFKTSFPAVSLIQ